MEPERRRWTEILAQSRDRLLATGDVSDEEIGPREEILRSWRRSYDDGASASALQSPYDDNLNLSTRLFKSAEPVIQRVHEDVQGSPITLILADSTGKVLLRKSGEPELLARLDRALLAPGFNYAERFVGTNGIGTALEGRAPAQVRGAEHFNEHLQVFACVGVPVRDPVTRRQLGVLDITTWADRADPALTALVRQAATSIEEGLLELASRGSRALLHEYLVKSRNREDVTIALSAEAFIGNGAAVRRLSGLGRDELWPLVVDALGSRDTAELPLLIGSDESLQLRLRAVRSATGALVGGLIEFGGGEGSARLPAPPKRAPEVMAPVAGLSPISIGPSVMVARMAAAGMPVCLVGEPGVGKRTMVEAVAAQQFPGRILVMVDAESTETEPLVGMVLRALEQGKPVLVRAVEALVPGAIDQILEGQSRHLDSSGWLAFTLRLQAATPAGDRVAESEVSAAGIPMVAVPPLRSRVQDLRTIVPPMVSRLSQGRVTQVSDALMTRLLREPWPQNLSEVSQLIEEMLTRVGGETLDVQHLPREFGSGMRRQLTPLEWMEREAIVEALRACHGDKTMAAESLGMSRASIYRKVKVYGIASGQH